MLQTRPEEHATRHLMSALLKHVATTEDHATQMDIISRVLAPQTLQENDVIL